MNVSMGGLVNGRAAYTRWREAALLDYQRMFCAWMILIEMSCDTADMHQAMKDAAYELDWNNKDETCGWKTMYLRGRKILFERSHHEYTNP